MPDDSGGVYTVPAGTLVNTGDTLLPSQHNPWALDMSTAMSSRFSKDGRAPATGNWNLNTFRITNLGAPVATNDAVNKAYADGLATTFADQGALFGLTLNNNGLDAVNDIDIVGGSAAASNTATPIKMVLASALGKRLDAAWTVGGTPGSTVGGLDTGAIANGTYHVYLIRRSDTGVVDACFSASASAPTTGGAIPVAYDQYRRIGSIIREAASIVPFRQFGDVFKRAPIVTVSATGAIGSVAITLNVPIGIVVQPILACLLQIPSASSATTSLGDAAFGAANTIIQSLISNFATTEVNADATIINGGFYTNTSGQIFFARTIATGTVTANSISTIGWIDNRGRT